MLTVSLFRIVEELISERVAPKKLPSGWKAIAKYLTPEERGSQRKDLVESILANFKELPKDDEFIAAAKAGEAKRGWYAKSAQSIQELFGPDTPRFCALLAATSPQVSVVENMRNAARIWRRYLAMGRPTDLKAIDAIGSGAIGEERWHKMGWKNNIVTALTTPEEDVPKMALSGFKVDNFRRNLGGDLAGVTCDAWMASFAAIDQQKFGSLGGYAAFTAKIRRVAEKMGWKPAEVQETIWSFFKALYEKQNINRVGKDALAQLKDSDVSDVPDFATLMLEDPDVRRELEHTGLGSRAVQASPDVRAGSGGDATPLQRGSEGGFVGAIGRIADRAQTLKFKRDLAEDIKFSYPLHLASVTAARGNTATLHVTDASEVAALRALSDGHPLQRTVTTQKYKNQSRPMKFLLVPKGPKWLFLQDPRVVLMQEVDSGVTVRVAGSSAKAVAIPADVPVPA